MNVSHRGRHRRWASLAVASATVLVTTCAPREIDTRGLLAVAAERYVRLALVLGADDPTFVDAYFGPPAWRADALRTAERTSPRDVARDAGNVADELADAPTGAGLDLDAVRRAALRAKLLALAAHADRLAGATRSFDAEAAAILDVEVDAVRKPGPAVYVAIDRILPGVGPLPTRLDRLHERLVVAPDRRAGVVARAVEECRRRTLAHLSLPSDEQLSVRFGGAGTALAAYRYEGDYRGRIEVSDRLPLPAHRVLEVACHEGYPGHHVQQAIRDAELVRDRGWMEFSISVVPGPQALIDEGAATVGLELAFPGSERLTFERDVLYPLAGVDPALAVVYDELRPWLERLEPAVASIARDYLDGRVEGRTAADRLEQQALVSPGLPMLRFIDTHRSYVLAYPAGVALVRRYLAAAKASQPDDWRALADLIASPMLPSQLR